MDVYHIDSVVGHSLMHSDELPMKRLTRAMAISPSLLPIFDKHGQKGWAISEELKNIEGRQEDKGYERASGEESDSSGGAPQGRSVLFPLLLLSLAKGVSRGSATRLGGGKYHA